MCMLIKLKSRKIQKLYNKTHIHLLYEYILMPGTVTKSETNKTK